MVLPSNILSQLTSDGDVCTAYPIPYLDNYFPDGHIFKPCICDANAQMLSIEVTWLRNLEQPE